MSDTSTVHGIRVLNMMYTRVTVLDKLNARMFLRKIFDLLIEVQYMVIYWYEYEYSAHECKMIRILQYPAD